MIRIFDEREEETKQLEQLVKKGGGAAMIRGAHGVGKTWLLNKLFDKGDYSFSLFCKDGILIVFIREPDDTDIYKLFIKEWKKSFERLISKITDPSDSETAPPVSEKLTKLWDFFESYNDNNDRNEFFKNLCDKFHIEGYKVTFVVDHFDHLFRNGTVSPLDPLVPLIDGEKLNLIVSSYRGNAVIPDTVGSWLSQRFTPTDQIDLKGCSKAAFTISPEEDSNYKNAKYIPFEKGRNYLSKAYELSGGNPGLFELVINFLKEIQDLNNVNVCNDIVRDAGVSSYFRRSLKYFKDSPDRDNLERIRNHLNNDASSFSLPEGLTSFANQLCGMGLLISDDGDYKLAIPLLKHYLDAQSSQENYDVYNCPAGLPYETRN